MSGKPFTMHWGSGYIEEEVQIETENHRPTIQLMHYTEGEAAGSYSVRFCHYDLRGRFQRSPLIVTAEDMAKLRKALRQTKKLKKLFALT